MKNYLTLIIVISAFFVSSCEQKKEEKTSEKPFELTETMLKTTTSAPAQMKVVKNQLTFFGKITADNDKLIEVYPVVGGNVIRVNVELGDYVKKGQTLAVIRSTEVADFEKQAFDANNDVVVAKNNLKVSQELLEGKLNTERDVIQAQSQYDKALSQQTRTRQTYQIYNLKPGSIYEVKAPISGFVIEKKINQDMLLRSDRTDNIFDIAQINEVWAIANVNESDINLVHLGEDAAVTTLSYPDKIFKGKIDKIFNIIDPETKAMKVRIQLQNPGYLLKPEMRANIQLSFDEKNSMLAVPSSAIIFDKSKNFAMVYKSPKNIETRPVEVYRQIGDISYISRGLVANEKVITHNQLLVYDALND